MANTCGKYEQKFIYVLPQITNYDGHSKHSYLAQACWTNFYKEILYGISR